jgi:hypothetical protein
MRRTAVFGGRVYSIVIAGLAGYVIGGWSGSVPTHKALSAAQTVALRFPEELADVARVAAHAIAPVGNAQFALLSPQPMVPQAAAAQIPAIQAAMPQAAMSATALGHQAPQSVATVQTLVQLASVQTTEPPPPAPAARPVQNKPAAAAARRANERPGFVLNDAQIASIKERLHLTPGQEEMWPAVEAALRNFAYTHLRDRRKQDAAPVQVASADPEVQDLKSAAIPLIMSFNSEQKDEVRNLAHVMGLDQLASQF